MVMVAFVGFPQDEYEFSAADVGLALAGMVARESNGDPTVGVLGPGATASAVAASWKVEIDRFVYVHQVSGAVQFSGISSPEQLDITPATGIPSGQARIDLVCWNPVEAELVILEGTVSATPVAPSAGGFAPIATVRVNNGDGMVIGGQVAAAFEQASLVGSRKSETRTVSLTLAGGSGSGAFGAWRDFTTVTFAEPFAEAPHLEVTAVFPSEAVQTMQITSVSATGFTVRGIRFGHVTVLAGSLTYTATEK